MNDKENNAITIEQLDEMIEILSDNKDIMKEHEEYKNLSQQYKELKSQIEAYSKLLDSTELKIALTDIRTGEREVWRKLGSKAKRYEQALDEIIEVIKKLNGESILTFPDLPKEENYKFVMKQCNEGYVEILNIINKAKGDENEQ